MKKGLRIESSNTSLFNAFEITFLNEIFSEFTAIHNNGDFLSSANFSDTVSVMSPNFADLSKWFSV